MASAALSGSDSRDLAASAPRRGNPVTVTGVQVSGLGGALTGANGLYRVTAPGRFCQVESGGGAGHVLAHSGGEWRLLPEDSSAHAAPLFTNRSLLGPWAAGGEIAEGATGHPVVAVAETRPPAAAPAAAGPPAAAQPPEAPAPPSGDGMLSPPRRDGPSAGLAAAHAALEVMRGENDALRAVEQRLRQEGAAAAAAVLTIALPLRVIDADQMQQRAALAAAERHEAAGIACWLAAAAAGLADRAQRQCEVERAAAAAERAAHDDTCSELARRGGEIDVLRRELSETRGELRREQQAHQSGESAQEAAQKEVLALRAALQDAEDAAAGREARLQKRAAELEEQLRASERAAAGAEEAAAEAAAAVRRAEQRAERADAECVRMARETREHLGASRAALAAEEQRLRRLRDAPGLRSGEPSSPPPLRVQPPAPRGSAVRGDLAAHTVSPPRRQPRPASPHGPAEPPAAPPADRAVSPSDELQLWAAAAAAARDALRALQCGGPPPQPPQVRLVEAELSPQRAREFTARVAACDAERDRLRGDAARLAAHDRRSGSAVYAQAGPTEAPRRTVQPAAGPVQLYTQLRPPQESPVFERDVPTRYRRPGGSSAARRL